MRTSTYYRLLKRFVATVLGLWMVYVLTILSMKDTSIDDLEKLLEELEQRKVRNVEKRNLNQGVITVDYAKYVDQNFNTKKYRNDVNDMEIGNNGMGGGQNAQIDPAQEVYVVKNENEDRPKMWENHRKIPFQEEDLVKTGGQQQLGKLAQLGGAVVQKRPEQEFQNVQLPPFVDSYNPNGLGEGGKGVTINIKNLTDAQKKEYNQGWSRNSFNQYLSDQISIHRGLPDGRSQACKEAALNYASVLPDVSVVIIFHNEAWSVLLRSVHSILSRTPDHLLREIILVDDLSTMDHLKLPLEKYFNSFAKVKIVRATKRQGLTRARLLGYYVSTAPVLVFLDSHIECFPGWLEPLTSRIGQDRTVVVFPTIEVISDEHFTTDMNNQVGQNGGFRLSDLTFEWQNIPDYEEERMNSGDLNVRCGWLEPLLQRIHKNPRSVPYPNIEIIWDKTFHLGTTIAGSRAIFRWKDLTFQWEFVPDYEKKRRKNNADPIRSPTMPGGLFAISRFYFERLGTYDPGLDYWGGENIELSFKAWMCGGMVELVTCSHVGHIFRRSNPIRWTKNIGSKNSIRVAEVWMDDYKNYFFERILFTLGDYGDVSERKKLREELQCRSFDWYLKNVYPNMIIPANMLYAGEIQSQASTKCVDSMGTPKSNQQSPKMYPCHHQGYNQFWHFSHEGQILQDNWHICVATGGQIVMRNWCEPNGPHWEFLEKDQTLRHVPTGKCLTDSQVNEELKIEECKDSTTQKWAMQPRRTDINYPS